MILKIIADIIIGIYSVSLLLVTLYCFLQFHLLLKYLKDERHTSSTPLPDKDWLRHLPHVTVQLPIFNERYVVERLIDNIVLLDYPINKLEIQLLDDSTDDTTDICLARVNAYKTEGFDILHLHRSERDGYKAGALKDGLQMAKGKFIAIFDADFLPKPDFLIKTLPYFNDREIGVVQTRWGHINENYSLLTKLQAFQLNVHFSIEQTGRQYGNFLLQFNGTGGIWRREAIEDAGGWKSDTLTEDLDLSYRAQLRGWRIKYLQDITSPAELPAEMNGLKSQQYRWMKGGAENARKLIPYILKSKMSFIKKVHAATHLLASSVFLLIFILGVLSVPVLFLLKKQMIFPPVYWIFMLGFITAAWIYYVGNSDTTWIGLPLKKRLYNFVFFFPIFLSFSMGLSLHNSIAVFEGYSGKKSTFIRTPKYNIQRLEDKVRKGNYESRQISLITILEGMMSVYFLLAVVFAIQTGKTSFVGYHVMLTLGFGCIFIYSIKHLSHR
jgi:cellulose synthase/poly-beta-1,6-N-acetylglucosamine synthase-like glycosyltransferase